jgi:hypothetical protein
VQDHVQHAATRHLMTRKCVDICHLAICGIVRHST